MVAFLLDITENYIVFHYIGFLLYIYLYKYMCRAGIWIGLTQKWRAFPIECEESMSGSVKEVNK